MTEKLIKRVTLVSTHITYSNKKQNMQKFVVLFCCTINIIDANRLIYYRPNDQFNNQDSNSFWSFGFTDSNDHVNFQLYPTYTANVYGNSEFSNLQLVTIRHVPSPSRNRVARARAHPARSRSDSARSLLRLDLKTMSISIVLFH